MGKLVKPNDKFGIRPRKLKSLENPLGKFSFPIVPQILCQQSGFLPVFKNCFLDGLPVACLGLALALGLGLGLGLALGLGLGPCPRGHGFSAGRIIPIALAPLEACFL